MGNTSSRPLINPRLPPEIYRDLGYGDIISNPLRAPPPPLEPETPPTLKGRRTFSSFGRRSTLAMGDRRVVSCYPKNYHW